MANLTFSNLVSEVFAHTGLDSTDTTNQTNVYRWLNYVQEDICSRWPWTFMLGREALATIPDYLTGTVSVNSGGTTVTGSGTAFTALQADGTYYIQFSGANDWYNVTARSSGTSITIGNAYNGTTNLSGATYTLRKFFYSLSATADEIIDIRNWNTPVKLIQCDFRTIDALNPLVQSTNAPYAYMMFGVDASGNQVFQPYPFPTDARLFEFRTKKRPVQMVVTSQEVVSIPNKFAHVIAWGAIAIGFAYLRRFPEAEAWNAKVEQRISQMKQDYKQSDDYQPVLRSIDSVSRDRWIQFPEQYPLINH